MNEISLNFLIPFLFLILSLLFAIESSTSLARIAGINADNLASGLQVQSGLSLLSRGLTAIFMPLLGVLSDKNMLSRDNIVTVGVCSFLIPVAILTVYLTRNQIIRLYEFSVNNLLYKGSYFPIGKTINSLLMIDNQKNKKIFIFFKIITILSYIPYYAAWPLIIYFLSIFPNNRGLIIGLSSIMNGINTLAIALYVDPFLIRLSKNKKLSKFIYIEQIKWRFTASCLACAPFMFIGFF